MSSMSSMSKKLTWSELSALCLELFLFLHGGADPAGALHLIAEEDGGARKEALRNMAEETDNGSRLSDAMEKSGLFPLDAVHMVRVGEMTGRVEESLAGLADYYDRMDATERRLRAAVSYPAVLFCAMTAVLLLLATKVLPLFQDLYESLGGAVSGAAGVVFAAGEVLSPWVPLFWCLLLLFAGSVLAVTTVPGLRNGLWNRMLMGRGKTGEALRNARFARALSMAIHSGLPGAEAVECAARVLETDPDGAERCRKCLERIENGGDFADAMGEAALLPETECRLLTLGLAGGNGERAAEEIARRMERDAEEVLDKTVSRLEPALVVISSLLVGGILLAVLLPLMDLMNALSY